MSLPHATRKRCSSSAAAACLVASANVSLEIACVVARIGQRHANSLIKAELNRSLSHRRLTEIMSVMYLNTIYSPVELSKSHTLKLAHNEIQKDSTADLPFPAARSAPLFRSVITAVSPYASTIKASLRRQAD